VHNISIIGKFYFIFRSFGAEIFGKFFYLNKNRILEQNMGVMKLYG